TTTDMHGAKTLRMVIPELRCGGAILGGAIRYRRHRARGKTAPPVRAVARSLGGAPSFSSRPADAGGDAPAPATGSVPLPSAYNSLGGIVKLLGMIVSPGNSRHIPDAIATDPTLRTRIFHPSRF